jgi:hypothetical protein
MKAFFSSITIAAPASRIWELLTDTTTWPQWNTTVDKVEGSVALGKTIKVHAKVSPGRAFPAKVVELVPHERMVWLGGMPLGLFRGLRTFTLTPQYGRIRFDMREEFTGILSPMIERSIPNLQPAFDEFARCLKSAAEND